MSLKWLFSFFIISIVAIFFSWMIIQYGKDVKIGNSKNDIRVIIQESYGESLKTEHIAELLELSVDNPQNLHYFDLEKGEKVLLSTPWIKQAKISKIYPNALYVKYELRKPIAYLGNISNTAFDDEGKLFPIVPFLSSKILPKIWLNIEFDNDILDNIYSTNAIGDKLHFVLKVIDDVKKFYDFKVLDIDFSNIDQEGLKDIVITIDDDGKKCYLRTKCENYIDALKNYMNIQHDFINNCEMDDYIVDCRVSGGIIVDGQQN